MISLNYIKKLLLTYRKKNITELYKSEKGRDRWEVLVEAQRLNDNPKILRYPENRPNNFILRILAEIFNIKVSKYNNRKPVFPRRLWFIEKYQKFKKLI